MKRQDEGRSLRDLYPLHLQLGFTLALALILGVFLTVRNLEVAPLQPPIIYDWYPPSPPIVLEDIEEPPPPARPRPVVDETGDEVDEGVEENLSEVPDLAPPPLPEAPLMAPPLPQGPDTVPFHAVEVKPQVVRQVRPRYPEIARRMGLEGRVMVKALVGEDGRVIAAEVVTGQPRGVEEILGPAAVEAVLRFRFSPGMQRDRPVRVWVVVPVVFQLQ